MQIEIPVSIGEVIDKITILEIKQAMITDLYKLANIEYELEQLSERLSGVQLPGEVWALRQALQTVNRRLWHIEDFKRLCEQEQRFDDEFIRAARSVYIYNDERAQIKRRINELSGSKIVEEKSYADAKNPAVAQVANSENPAV